MGREKQGCYRDHQGALMLCSENYNVVEQFSANRNGGDKQSAAMLTQMHEEQAGPSLTSLLVKDRLCTKCSQRLPPVPSQYGGEPRDRWRGSRTRCPLFNQMQTATGMLPKPQTGKLFYMELYWRNFLIIQIELKRWFSS